MPVRIPDSLPAKSILEQENIFVMTQDRATHQDIRPLKLGILNLMPLKTKTETSLLRCLSNTPLQIDIDFIHTASYESRHTSQEYLETFYKRFDQIKHQKYDGFIITGAPVETLHFHDVDYWDELSTIIQWTKTNVFSTLFICWGAQAGMYELYGVEKYPLAEKVFGIFKHHIVTENTPLLRGFDEIFEAPHSRHTEVKEADLKAIDDLNVLAVSDEAGVYIATGENDRQIFVFGHPEYEADTLAQEYFRDVDAGLSIEVPKHYFPQDDPSQTPRSTWRSHATLLYTNWLNYYVYQRTPFDLEQL